jgi:hypothetical protein
MMRTIWWKWLDDENDLMMKTTWWWERLDDEDDLMMRTTWWWERFDDENDLMMRTIYLSTLNWADKEIFLIFLYIASLEQTWQNSSNINPRIESRALISPIRSNINPRIGFELLSETQLYDQAIRALMRRSITEYWSNRRVLWQQYSSSYNSRYRRRSYRLLTDFQNQSLDSIEIVLNRCKHECRCRCLAFNNWLTCMKFFSRQMFLRMRHLKWFFSTSASIRRRNSQFSCLFQVISWLFS